MTWGRRYWPYWIIAVSLAFLIPELLALFTNGKNSLSQYVWDELGVSPHMTMHTVAWWVSLIGVLLAFAIVVAHIWFREFV